MKKILLSSAAIVAFAGAAAADVSFSGSAKLGYNDDHEGGIYADSDLDIALSQELANGWTAAISYGLELEQHENGAAQGGSFDGDLTLSLTNGTYGLYYGKTSYAAQDHWSGVSDMAQDGFSENDGEETLKFTADFGEVAVAVSALVDTDGSLATPGDQGLVQTSVGVSGELGAVNFSLAYQEEAIAPVGASGDFNAADVLGVSVGGSFAGADVTLAYAKSGDETSTGVAVSYPVGTVTVGAFYVDESASADAKYGVSAAYSDGPVAAKLAYKSINDVATTSLEGSYEVSEGFTVYAGILDGDDLMKKGMYVGAGYDLGGGASVLASYVDVDATNEGDNEFGAKNYRDGATIQLSFKF